MSARILVVGLPLFGKRTAEALTNAGYDARYAGHPGRDARQWVRLSRQLLAADAVYAIGSSVARRSPLDFMVRLRKKVLIHWVGSDVTYAVADFRAGRTSHRLLREALHVADAPWLVEELRELGIRAEERLLPLPVTLGEPVPFPPKFHVALHLPPNPHAAYDAEGTLHLVRSLPGIQFSLVGGFEPAETFPNLRVLGFIDDIGAFFQASTVLVRLTRHDGMAHSVLEAMSYGRHVIWTQNLPGVHHVKGAEEARQVIVKLHDRFLAGSLDLNHAGAENVRQRYQHDRVVAQICQDLDRLLA